MSDLIAIGYPDEATAEAAAEEARGLARDLIIEPDAIAAIVRDKEGKFHVHTSHHPVGAGATWGMWWGVLFGLLFFIPVFGLAVGAGLGALMGKVTKTGIDKEFQDQVRGMLQPGTSALFLMVEKVTPDKAVDAMCKYGGTVLKTSLSKEDEKPNSRKPCTVGAPGKNQGYLSPFSPECAFGGAHSRWFSRCAPGLPACTTHVSRVHHYKTRSAVSRSRA